MDVHKTVFVDWSNGRNEMGIAFGLPCYRNTSGDDAQKGLHI